VVAAVVVGMEDVAQNELGLAPSASLLLPKTNPPLHGKNQYLGGEYDPESRRIYCIPGHATQVLVIDTETDECELIGNDLNGPFK
jgi:hypothetical protein